MRLKHGKHKGELLQRIMRDDPNYIWWILNVKKPKGWLRLVRWNLESLMESFDRIPYRKRCRNPKCDSNAKCCVADNGRRNPWYIDFWCEACNPSKRRSVGNNLQCIRTFREAIDYINNTGLSIGTGQLIMKAFCEAKEGVVETDAEFEELTKIPNPILPDLADLNFNNQRSLKTR